MTLTLETPVQQAVSRREQILAHAARLFAHKGYQATGMRELAEAVGIEPASLYSHVQGKEQVLWEIADRCAQDFIRTVSPLAEQHESPLTALRSMIIAHVEVTARNQTSAAVFDHEWQHLSTELRARYDATRSQYADLFRSTLTQAIEVGEIRPVDTKFTTLALLSALNYTYKWYRPDGSLSPAQVGENLADLLLNGLHSTKN